MKYTSDKDNQLEKEKERGVRARKIKLILFKKILHSINFCFNFF